MNTNTNTQTDTETIHMSLQIAYFFPHFYKMGKYLLPLLAGLFILAACGGGGAAPTTVTPDTTEAICETNLFDDACKAPDVATKRAAKIEECITGGAAGDFTCRQARDANPCLTDPLAPTCTVETVGADFVAHLETAKVERANFCRQGNNISEETELCGSAVTTLCSANPFDTVCFADTTYRDTRITACIGATPPADSATVCRRSEITDIVCLATGTNAAPFNTTICGADDGVIYAAVRQEFCRANLSDGLCTNTISTFCATIDAGKFTDSLCGTSASAAVRGTYCVGLQAGDRPGACGDDATEGSLIRAYCEGGSAEALLDTNNNCAVSLANACLTQPFGHACTSDANIRARADMCRLNTNGDNSCVSTITAICAGKADGGNAIDATPLDSLCAGGTYDEVRQTACDRQDVTTPNEDCLPVIRSLCTAEPFNPSAGEGTTKFDCAGSATYDPARNDRNTFCRGAPRDGKCTRAVEAFCGTPDAPHNTNNIFDNLCNVGYDDARGKACGATAAEDTLPTGCGSEDTSGYLLAYCETEDGAGNNIHCPVQYEASGVRADRWQTDAVDADKNPLTPIPAGGASKDDDPSNFIVGGEDGLDFVLDDTITQILREGDVRLDAVTGNNEDNKSGFGYARVRLAGAEPADQDKNYVGLLSGTDVGAPIRDNSKTGVWSAKGTIFLSEGVFPLDFILDVSFGPNTIKTRATNLPSITLFGTSTLAIDGKFTDAGVLYGTTDFYVGGFANRGTLSGLIGVDGAVGVFASDTLARNAYAGGFVAALGCTDYPFNVGCTSDVDIRARATACLGNIDANGAGGCDATARTICMDGTTGSGGAIAADILDPLCLSAPAFVDDIIGACNNAQNNQGVFADCPAFLAEVCPISGARHADCPAQVQTGNADFILWKQDATDATNTNKLTILPAITGQSDRDYSYVEGRRDGLERGDDYLTEEEKSNDLVIDKRNFGQFDFHQTLRLSELAGSEDTSSGVAFRRFSVQKSGRSVATKRYVGVLSDTDLGAPISASTDLGALSIDNPMVAIWDARLEFIIIGSLQKDDFTMEVNFNDKTIKTSTTDPAFPEGGFFSRTFGNFIIDGKFTNTGVIYGTTSLKRNGFDATVGSLTGLIGERGAVGVFFSNDRNATNSGTYVGGFVAVPMFCASYPFANGCDTDEQIMTQLRMCRDDINTNGVGGCDATLNIICNVGSAGAIAGDPFADPLCGSSSLFDNARVKACVSGLGVGDFLGCDSLLENLCPLSGLRNSECPVQVATGADFIRWKQDAVDTDGTTALTILTEVGADDADENYVQAGADELNRGFLVDDEDKFIGNPGRIGRRALTLRDVGLLDDTASGVKHERYVSDLSNPFISRTNTKFYVGILSGTDLGAPLTAENTAEMIWSAKLVMVDEYGLSYSNDFTLEVNFDNKTINTASPIDLASSSTTGTLTLTGKFTSAGVIYGTSQLKLMSTRHPQRPNEELTSDGSLTGLIGEKGAVGAFISKSALDSVGLYSNTAGRYAGGFVARNNSLCRGDTLFDIDCYKSPRIIRARADMCEGNMNVNGGAGGCAGTVTDICSDTNNSGSAINPFHGVCDTGDDTYDESRRLSCVNNRDGYSGSSCADLTTRICITENKPLNTICADGTNTYDVPRQAACVADSIDESLMIEGCAPVITDLCRNEDAFSGAAGAGDVKFDCLGSDLYHGARQDACLYGSLQPDVCTATIAQTCDVDKEYFSGLCKDMNDEDYDFYEQARINTCAAHADEIQSRGADAEDDVIAQCFNFLDVDCSFEPFKEKCYVVNLYESKRLDKCSSDLDALEGAYATPADCNRPELSGAICAQTGENANPFAPICAEPTAVAVDFDLVAVQQGFCRDGANINGADCADTVENFCDVASGADLFDNLCFTGTRAVNYNDYRVAACQVDNADTDVSERCPLVLSALCPQTGSRSPACVTAGTLPTSVWVYTAPNANNTGRLEILESAQQDDADTNYIQGNATELNLGAFLESGTRVEADVKGDLSITDLANVDNGDATGGVAFIRINYDGFTSTNKVKYYAGLLNNVDLGGPLADNTANAIWHASFSAIVNGAVQTDTKTTIVINFDNNTNSLTTNDDDLVMLSGDTGSITINARFNSAGVIYGTSSWTSGANSSTGSVTGLIGAKGAIGAFVSSGENTGDNTNGEYVGGFVAAPVAVECVGLVAFTNSLCTGPVGRAGRIAYAETCRTTDCTEFVNGMDGVMISACTHKTGSNPHQAGCESDGFDAERIARNEMCIMDAASYDPAVCGAAVDSCFTSGTDNNCGQLAGAYCDVNMDLRCDNASLLAAIVCRDLPLDSRCDTGYDEERQTACGGEDVTTPRMECADVISTLCLANPLDNAAGAGKTKFDCAGSVTYIEERQTECGGQNVTNPDNKQCVPVITALCNGDPFNDMAGVGTVKFNCAGSDDYHTARRDVCYDDIITKGGTNPACTATIAQACTDDIFDGLCFDRTDGKYSDYETERVSYCQTRIYRTDNFTNDTADSRTCAAFVSTCPTTPFEARCTIADDDAYASDRLRLCGGTIDDLTAAFATPADCNTDDFSGVICAVTGVDANPFAPICSDPTAVAMDLDLVAVRQGFCRDGANINEADCADTVTTFCDTASGASLFDVLCTTGDNAGDYLNYRVAACEATDDRTGVYNACTDIIDTHCTNGSNPACTPAQGTLPTSVWLYTAPNANNTGRLKILAEVGTDDAYTNYVQGDETGLNTDVLYDAGTLKAGAIIRSVILSITDLDNVDDNATGGVAAAWISSPEFTDNPLGTKHRYYAGLLDNVDLGGPLVDGSADGIWNARFYALYGTAGSVQTDLETSMIVNFDAKSLKTRDLADIYGPADPVVLSGGAGRITINANFTTAGVIYGTSSWSDGRLDGNSSAGTVTGLIGKYGAIGAFLGSGENIGGNTQGEYAGGFVAAPVDCSLTENPFYRLCSANISEVMMAQIAFAEICRLNAITKGCDQPINGISGLTVNDCTNSDSGNPYQTGCLDNVVFDAERAARNLNCGLGNVSNAGQCAVALDTCFGSVTNAGCDAFVKATCDVTVNRDGRCDTDVPMICGTGGTDPLSIICETGYDAVRQTECMGQDIANPSDSRCAPVIAELCNSDPFNAMAGVGTAKFNCTDGNTYLSARVMACETTPESIAAGSCEATRLTACAANPFYTLCDDSASYSGSYQNERNTACNANPAAYGDGCDYLKTECATAPNVGDLDICRDDERYAERREVGCAPNSPSTTSCAYTTIAYRCRIDPLNPRAGLSFNKYNCAGLGEVITRGETIDADGNIVPVGTTVNYADIRSARVKFCKNPDNSQDARCMVAYTQTFLARCAEDPFNSPCRENGNHFVPEQEELIADCRHDDSLPQCDVHGIRTRLCTTAADGTPFAPFCDTSDFLALRGTALRVAYCNLVVDGTRDPDPRCAPFADEFCSNAVGNGLFNSICNADYRIEQVAACTANMGIAGCPTLLETNCPEGNTKPECAIATLAAWENHAVNSDNTARLDVLDEAEADDPVFNYVKAGADGLNLDFIKDEDGNFRNSVVPAVPLITREVTGIGEDGVEITITVTDQYAVGERINSGYLRISKDENGVRTKTIADERVLKSYDGGTYEDTAKTSGVAFASINYGGFTYDREHGHQRYYAGILSGTDLGGPVTTKTESEWTGKFGIILSDRYYTKDFTLTIDFDGKSIKGTDTNGCTAGEKTCPVYDSDPFVDDFVPNIIERLDLTGNFNDAGVIYGTSRVTWNNTNLFVYRDCRQNLVTPATDNNPAVYNRECRQERIEGRLVVSRGTLTGLIGERGAVGVFAGVGTDTGEDTGGSGYVGGFVVDNPAVSPDCSTATGKPFDLVLCPNADEVRRDLCINRGINGENLPTGVTASNCNTTELVRLICRGDVAPLDPLCTDDFYDYTRQLVCGGQDVNNPAQPLCAPVIEKLCTAEPFNRVAGPGANKFDCTSVNSEPVIQARNTRIALCLADATKDSPLCKQGHVPVALASCADNPDGPICRADGIRAALTVCSDNPNDPICKADDVRAALTACSDNPRGLICTQGVTGIVSACEADPNDQDCRDGADEILNFCSVNQDSDNQNIAICDTPGLAVRVVCVESPLNPICTQNGVSAVLTACPDTSNDPFCTQEGVSAIVTACVINPQSPLCLPRGVPSVLTTCAADPLDAVCTDVAEHYTQARVDRLETCRGKASLRVGVKCDNALPTICAQDDTPFAQACKDYDTTQAVIAQTCAKGATPDAPLCDTVVLPVSGGDDVLVKHCIENPYTAGCAESVFYAARAAICESEATSFTAGCLTDSDFASTYASADGAREAQEALIARCADSGNTDKTNCDTDIGGGTTLAQCIENPFLPNCAGTETLARCRQLGGDCSIAAVTTALMTYRNAFVARCADSGNTDKMGCDGVVNDGKTIASCITAFNDNDCARSGAFNAYRGVDCTIPANAFAPLCQGGIGEAVITARAELALGCAVTAGGTGCNTIVSGSLTVDMCNTNPFATGCEDAAFANVRFEMCKTAEPKPAACGVKEGQRITSYVQGGASGLELGDSIYKDEDDLAVYREDDPKTKNIHEGAVYEDDGVAFDDEGNPRSDDPKTPIDESKIRVYNDSTTVRDESKNWIRTDYDVNDRVLREGIEQGGLTLNDLVDATDNENHGFAYAYIPGGRGADDINGWDRYYAGLLSGTDVGASITADAKWNGKIAIVSGLNGSILTEQANFALTIDFTDKTLTSGDIVLPKLNGLFAINGKFTTPTDSADSGVIYGATSLRTRQDSGELASIGSVTGLIGSGGAVGAFISSGEGALVNTFGEYAGGFVASSTAPDIRSDCSANLLNAECIANDAQYYDICVTTAEINTQATIDFCVPFVQRYIDRETECASAPLDNENHACAPVLAQLCDFNSGNIFKDSAGTGATKFNCTKVTAFTATRAQICRTPAYANGGAIVNLDGEPSVTKKIDACGQIITDICAGDPFTQTVKSTLTPATNLCDSTYNDVRETTCGTDIANSDANAAPTRCFDTILRACADNPFDTTLCSADNVNFTATRLRLCYANMAVSDTCTTVISTNCPTDGRPRNVECHSTRFTAWADSFNTDDSDAAVASIPEDETKTARILLGRANGLDTKTNVTSIHAPHTVLRFEEGYSIGDRGNIIREEGYETGFAVFSARTTGSTTIGHYAGILFGTDVGLPITDPAVDATWDGDMAWVSDDGAQVKRAYAFTLNVDFIDGSISGSGITDSLGRRVGANDILSFNAKWNGNGILTGTTALRINILDKDLEVSSVRLSPANGQGTLTGMIGNRGAVGVFASNDDATIAYAGGFIAKPATTPAEVAPTPPTEAIWATATRPLAAGSAAFTSATRFVSNFIRGGENGLGLSPEFVLRLDKNAAQDSAEYKSGVALFFGDTESTRFDRYYAGLLSGTTVGANLPYRVSYQGVASAIWSGVISARFGNHRSIALGRGLDGITIDSQDTFFVTDTNFQLDINFETSTIKTPEGKGSFNMANLRFDGGFDRNGIMSGTVATGAVDSNQETNTYGPGTFTGIIGQDAAIGVFKADRGQAGVDTKKHGYVGGFIATACDFDVFNPTCLENDAEAVTAYCTNTTANQRTNPFNPGCNNEAGIGNLRLTACMSDSNVDTETCPGLLVAFCADTTANTGKNPFTRECDALAETEALTVEALEMARDTACLNFGTQARSTCAGRPILRTECTPANPYAHVGCNTSIYVNDQHRQAYCLTPAGIKNSVCPNANTADWVASFTDDDELNTAPDSTPTNEFLQIADKTISTAGTKTEADGTGDEPTPTTLDFGQITLATPSMALDTNDGLAYFSGYQATTLYHYAGIFGSTDLGAPIDANITATWTAMLSINGTETTFDLDVVFDGAVGMDNTVKGFVVDPIDANDLLIDGTFTANGVIEGDVHYAEFTSETTPETPPTFNGTLSGLISTEGAVAVFVGTGYSGGFVAVPDTVSFGDWQSSFDAGGFNNTQTLLASGVDATGFAANTASFITLNATDDIVLSNQTITDPTILRLDSGASDGQKGYESGVAFWHGNAGAVGSEVSQYYAGLLVGTDLGAPLDENSNLGAIWTGKIDGITNGDVLDETEVKFEVMFGGTTTFANSVGSIKSIANQASDYTYAAGADTVGAVNVNAPNTDGDAFNNTFDFTGGFNAQGVITGTVAHINSKPTVGGTVNGVFNGLIGVDGAVGVFKSNDNQAFGFIGGFHAKPPAGN